jgi:hypothetical protein
LKKLSLKKALLKCFEDEPKNIFGIQELCAKVQTYYPLSEFQMELDPKYPQPRYEHEVRSQISRLKTEHKIVYPARNQYKLA